MLAQCGYGSLRGIEELIIAGRITINRQPAEVGQKVGPTDQVRINGELVRLRFAPPRARVLLYHKPAGEIVSRSDPEGRPTVFDKLPRVGGAKWVAVGRLDFNSEGLLLFTTLGELANRLMHPRYQVEREYAVRLMGTLSQDQERMLREGIELEDGVAKVLSLSDGGGEGANHWYTVVLPEGRNREVRRLFEALGMMVSRLIRTRYGIVNMPPQLKRGQTLELEQEDLGKLLAATGLSATEPSREDGRGQRGDGDAHGPRRDEDGEIDGNREPPPAAPVVHARPTHAPWQRGGDRGGVQGHGQSRGGDRGGEQGQGQARGGDRGGAQGQGQPRGGDRGGTQGQGQSRGAGGGAPHPRSRGRRGQTRSR